MTIYKMPHESYRVSLTLSNRGTLVSPELLVWLRLRLAGQDTHLGAPWGYYTLGPGQSQQLNLSGALDGSMPENTPLDLRVRVYKSPNYYSPRPYTEADYAQYPDALLAEAVVQDAYRVQVTWPPPSWVAAGYPNRPVSEFQSGWMSFVAGGRWMTKEEAIACGIWSPTTGLL